MKTQTKIIRLATALAVSGFASHATLAGAASEPYGPRPDDSAQLQRDARALNAMGEQASAALLPGECSLDEAIGASVRGSDGEKLGAIADIIVDSATHQAKFAVIKSDNWLDGKQALVPLSELSAYEEATHDDRGAIKAERDGFQIDMSEHEFDQLATVEIKAEDDLAAAIASAASTIDEAFGTQIAQQSASSSGYERGSELRDVSLSPQSGAKAAEVEDVVVNLAQQGEMHLILAGEDGLRYRIPANEIEFQPDKQIRLKSPAAIDRYEVSALPSADGDYQVVASSSSRSDRESSEQRAISGTDKDQGDQVYSSNGLVDQTESRPTISRSDSSVSSDDGSIAASGTDKGKEPARVYSSNGLVDQSEEPAQELSQANTSSSSRADDSYAVIEDEGTVGDEEVFASSSAKYDFDEPAALMSAESLLGVTVEDRNGDTVGKIEDVLIRQDTGAPAFAIVETDSWFSSKSALVPIQSLSPAMRSDSAAGGQASAESDDQKPESVSIHLSEDEFDRHADLEGDAELSSYVEENRDSLAQRYGLQSSELPAASVRYERASMASK